MRIPIEEALMLISKELKETLVPNAIFYVQVNSPIFFLLLIMKLSIFNSPSKTLKTLKTFSSLPPQ